MLDSSTPTPPEVSVVIPTRDRWPLLSRALHCALAQEGVALEVIVVDDASAEPMPAAMRAALDPRVTVLRNDPNLRVARTRNRGIEAARGEWIAFLDDDDLWAPGKLAAQLAAAREVEGAALVYTGTVWLNGEGQATALYEPTDPLDLRRTLRMSNPIGGPSAVMARRDAILEVGGFDPTFSVMADWDLWIRLADAYPAAACPGQYTGYVVHAGSMHQTDMEQVWREFRNLKARRSIPGERFGGHDFRVWMAGTLRGQGRRVPAARAHAAIGWHDRQPRELARAAGLLLGERAMRAVAGPLPPPAPKPPTPPWVASVLETAQGEAPGKEGDLSKRSLSPST